MSTIADRFPPYVMLLLAITGTIVSATGAYWTLGRDVRDLEEWTEAHELLHRERLAENASQFAAVGQRLAGVEADRRRIDELTFRIGATEENARRTGEAIAQLQATANAQASDIRVMREILERLDQRRADVTAPIARRVPLER